MKSEHGIKRMSVDKVECYCSWKAGAPDGLPRPLRWDKLLDLYNAHRSIE